MLPQRMLINVYCRKGSSIVILRQSRRISAYRVAKKTRCFATLSMTLEMPLITTVSNKSGGSELINKTIVELGSSLEVI